MSQETVQALSRLVAAAGRVADRAEPSLIESLSQTTGLSEEGVRHALATHLERDVPLETLAAIVRRARPAEEITLILSANVFTAALRALVLARASAPRVVVRPSRREPWFAREIIVECNDPSLVLADALELSEVKRGVVHAYGSDASLQQIEAKLTVPLWAHGSGLGIAWLSARAPLEASARALAEDVVAFDQRGCLSPRLVYVEGSQERAGFLADALFSALGEWESRVPRGLLFPEERAELARLRDELAFLGEFREGRAHAVAVVPQAPPLLLPPGRHVVVVPVRNVQVAHMHLAPISSHVVACGSDDQAGAREVGPRWARISELGRMQRPPLDGPVDGRDDWRQTSLCCPSLDPSRGPR